MRTFESLQGEQKRRVRQLAANNCNFIAATISPPPATDNVRPYESRLESVSGAILYFLENGVTRLTAQIKAMGSRATITLSRDRNACKLNTRNGFNLANYEHRKETINPLIDLWHNWFINQTDFEQDTLIIDGELMPWNYLSLSLVDRVYNAYYAVNKAKSEIYKKHPEVAKHHWVEDAVANEYNLEVFKSMVDGFNDEANAKLPSFHAFDILNLKDRNITMENRNELLRKLPMCVNRHIKDQEHYLTVDITDQLDVDKLHALFRLTIENGLEGIVVKPADLKVGENRVSALKVRTPQYLTMTYGHNYTDPEVLGQIIKNKNVSFKLKASMIQYNRGCSLLKIPTHSLNINDEKYIDALSKAVMAIDGDKELDPRLQELNNATYQITKP